MKTKIILCILFLTVPLTAFAVPGYMTYQGKVIGSNGAPITGVVEVTFALYSQETGGSAVWTEPVDVAFDDGYFNVSLGTVNALDQDLFDGSNLFMGITLDGQDEFVPRSRINSIPYSFLAGSVIGKVDAIDGLSVNGTPLIDSDGQWLGALEVSGPLEVQGEVLVASSGLVCSSERAGMLRWNSDLNTMQVCDGSQWGNMGSSGSGSGDLLLPEITSISPEQIDENTDTTITINGQGFVEGCEVEFGNVLSDNMSFESDTELQATTGDSLTTGTYRVRITNPNGLRGILEDAVLVDDAPEWITAEGEIGYLLDFETGEHFTLEASDSEDQTMTYTVTAGALPTGLSLDSSTGVISGDPDDVSDSTVSNFTVTATDTAPVPNTTDRDFSILVMHRIGADPSFPGDSCSHILEVYSGENSGVFWIDIDGEGGEDPFQVYCEMESHGGGWTMVANIAPNDGNSVGYNNQEFWSTDAEYGDFDNALSNDYKSKASYMLTGSHTMIQSAETGSNGAVLGWRSWPFLSDRTWDSMFYVGIIGVHNPDNCETESPDAVDAGSTSSWDDIIRQGGCIYTDINPSSSGEGDTIRLSTIHHNNTNNQMGGFASCIDCGTNWQGSANRFMGLDRAGCNTSNCSNGGVCRMSSADCLGNYCNSGYATTSCGMDWNSRFFVR